MSFPRLAAEQLSDLPRDVRRPRYAREDASVGIVHLGAGAFHRAHQALYTEEVMNRQGGQWGICGVSLRSRDVRDSLAPQDFLYTVAVRDGAATTAQVVGAIRDVLVAPDNPQAVVTRLAAPSVQVVTLTITEKGYCLNPADGQLDLAHPDIVHDLAREQAPRSAIGLLAAGLQLRQRLDLGGLTLLSCDNLASNGHKLRAAVLAFAARRERALAEWIDHHCSFPCSMVDRIVPATTGTDREQLAQRLGVSDQAAVVTEPFTQWVIEERFAGPVPRWDLAGAQWVPDVAPFEEMKLRMLNASHSALAYLGCLAGIRSIAEVMEEQAFVHLLRQQMQVEVMPTLADLGDFDLTAYGQQLLTRFANPGLEHLTRQIAQDGSQKIPQRLLPVLRWQLANSGEIEAISLGLAAWIRYTRGVDERGGRYSVDDPLALEFQRLEGLSGGSSQRYLEGVLELDSVFDRELAMEPRLRRQLSDWLDRLDRLGAVQTVREAFA